MAVEDFGGEVLGRNIVVLAADHKNEPQRAVRIATDWIDNQGVKAIVDLTNSAVALAVQKLANERSKITMTSLAGSTDLTGSACSPTGFQWTFDNYSNSATLARELVSFHQDTWFFITADYAFGWSLEREASEAVIRAGGRVLGAVRHPLNESNFGPLLARAQESNAKVIALANAGEDTVRAIKQAAEIGISPRTQTLVPMLVFISDVHQLGLDVAKGMTFVDGFYWDLDEVTRAWSKRFYARQHAMPTMGHAGTYSAVLHYLRAVQAAGTDEVQVVTNKIRDMPVKDFFASNGRVRLDGRMVHDMYVMQVKYPDESSGAWDYYKLISTIPGDEAFRPLSQSECPLARRQ
jgi:branched-chain amino acid transport system substrate-binding protein